MAPPGSSSSPAGGASPLFPPRYEQPVEAKGAILEVIHQDPRAFGIPGTRWTLERIHQVCDWLGTTTPASLWRLLDRLAISWKRGRDHVYSPDPDYLGKLAQAAVLVEQGRAGAGGVATLYLDELTFYRQPTLAHAYAERGRHQPLAERSYRSNTPTRLVAILDVRDGRVLYQRGERIGIAELVGFYQQVRGAYAGAPRIYVLQDNWPQHFHPDVLVALEPQESPWPRYRPPGWPTEPSPEARRKWGCLRLPIQLVPLPTYAPWTNPIEKLWRYLKQEVLHLHRLADQLDRLRQQVDECLDRFALGSDALLRYVGLLVPN
jgi:transposase